jgi:hypothetical protein
LDIRSAIPREMLVEAAKGLKNCSATFRVGVFDHDAVKDFGGVEEFEDTGPSANFIAGESSVSVLH